jgi:hypothetical protein
VDSTPVFVDLDFRGVAPYVGYASEKDGVEGRIPNAATFPVVVDALLSFVRTNKVVGIPIA